METIEIYNVSIFPLISARFAVQWSDDNQISILTERGIHIFELIPSPLSPISAIKFFRSFIYAPLILPSEVITTKVESKVWNMYHEDVYSFIMEESLTPKVSDLKEIVPKIIDLTWSPKSMVYPNKCLLAILTSAGAVIVIHKISKDWYPVYDLSSIRHNTIANEINTQLKDTRGNSPSFETIRNCIKTLQASSITWSKLFTNFAYFAVAYYNGDVIIYKLPRILNCNEIPEPTIVGTIKLQEYVKINVLHWISIDEKEHLIIVGYFDGRIYGVRIDIGQKFEVKFIDKYYDYRDRIAVSSVRVFPHTNSDMKVLISKGSFVFLIRLTSKGRLKSIEHIQLEGFMISGMTCISSDFALITTENSTMFLIDTQANISKILIKNGLPQTYIRYLGLAHSPSTVMFVNVTSPNSTYDHLVMKEPSKMYIFGLKNESWDPSTILNNKKWEIFEQVWDCLEVIRMKATRAVEPADELPKLPTNLERLSLNELRMTMWTSVIMEICDKKKVIQGIGSITGEISEAQPLIFVCTACNYIDRLLSKSSLSDEEEDSIYLLRKYLEVYLADEENKSFLIYKRVKDIIKKISRFDSKKAESCNLCGEVINDLPWKSAKCPQGHILPRCAITLLQITGMQYKKCPICCLIFHSCLDRAFEETRCLFCDVPALHENRVLGSIDYISEEKSLSRQKNCTSDASEDREMEAATEES